MSREFHFDWKPGSDAPPSFETIEEERGQTFDGRRIFVRYQKIGDVISNRETIVRDRMGNVIPPPPREQPTDPLMCPSCKVVNPRSGWEEVEVPCEDCGDHIGMQCPYCHEVSDTVYVTLGAETEGQQP